MKLNNQNIDSTMLDIENFFKKAGVSSRDSLKLRLVLEESLLRYQEIFGADHEFKFFTRKFLSTPKITIRVKGQTFNPLENNVDDSVIPASIMQNLLNYETIKIPGIPGGSITIALLLAILASFIISQLSPATQSFIISGLVTPIILLRFLVMVIFTEVLSVFVGALFFPVVDFSFSGEILAGNSSEMQKIFELFLSIIPQNVIAPF